MFIIENIQNILILEIFYLPIIYWKWKFMPKVIEIEYIAYFIIYIWGLFTINILIKIKKHMLEWKNY